jgi:dihydrofolate reductase
VVLTRDRDWRAEGAEVIHETGDVNLNSGEIWITGGAAIYREFLPLATHILRTRIDLRVAGDTHAPELGDEWVISGDSGWQTSPDGVRYVTEELFRVLS